jgi:hypothetical protein
MCRITGLSGILEKKAQIGHDTNGTSGTDRFPRKAQLGHIIFNLATEMSPRILARCLKGTQY